jgi:Fe-S-cluster containining protein
MTSSRELVVHARSSAFSYQCRACTRCCYGKRIAVNPYELARLSRNLGITTTELIEGYTVDGGIALAARADSSCVFLGPNGCSVHPDRPLVCRLYPLGRIVQADGSEYFVENAPHPETRGVYGGDGTVGAYLESQGVAPFIAAADRYYAVWLMLTQDELTHSDRIQLAKLTDDASSLPAIDAQAFVDADLAVAAHASRGEDPHLDVETLMGQHLALIERWAAALAQRGSLESDSMPGEPPVAARPRA